LRIAMSVHIHEKFEFHITAPNGVAWQAYPHNATLEFKWEKDNDWGFFRKTLQTDLIFTGDDFTQLLSIEDSDDRCQFILIDIHIICDEVSSLWWPGRMRCTAGEWDKSLCRLKIKAEPLDDYTCLFDNWEKEIDFSILGSNTLLIAPQYSVETKLCTWKESSITPSIKELIDLLNENTGDDAFLETIRISILLQVFVHCQDLLDAGSTAWTLLSATYTEFFGVIDYDITVAREYAPGTCDGGPVAPDADEGWVLLTDDCPTDSLWVRKITSGIIYDGAVGTYETPIHFAYPLRYILDYFFTAPCSTPIVSNFFNINPDATAPDNEAYQKAAVWLTDVHVVHLSDFIKDDEDGADTHATVPYSLKSILLNLPGNIDIAIDNGSLIIEHVSYYRRTQMLDLTNADHFDLNNGNAKYKYNKLKIPKSEKFGYKSETDGVGKDFDGLSITYDNACVDKDSKEKAILFEIYHANVKYLFEHKADYQNDLDGLIILSVADGKILYDTCPLSGELKLNGHFAISTLHQNYYKWDRPLPTGIMNGEPTQFFRWLRQKQQSDVKVRMCCDDYGTFDPDDLVKTQMGWGEVDDASLQEPTGLFKLQILHH